MWNWSAQPKLSDPYFQSYPPPPPTSTTTHLRLCWVLHYTEANQTILNSTVQKLKPKPKAKVQSKTQDHIQIKIVMPNPSQEPPASSKAPNEDLKDIDVLCTFKIKIESQNLEYGCTKYQWPYTNQDQCSKPQSGTSSILQSLKSRLKDMDVLCTFKIKIESRNSEYWCIKD